MPTGKKHFFASESILGQKNSPRGADKAAGSPEPAPRHSRAVKNLFNGFNWLFLPRGYPHSTSEDYLEYQIWDTLQGFCGYLKGVVLTLSFLKGMGVGSSDGTLENAMVVWVARGTTSVVVGLLAGFPTFTKEF